ncbi:MAG: Asp23/Gls24 family envelope stress response protein [Opitutaceae bacterium]|nr:Asp23/Gls24 family envelope stress response protein [Opitutaceae bacterium]
MQASADFVPPTRIDDQPELGEIKINHTVVASIVRLAALQIKGVAAVGGGLVDGISELFSKRESDARGVKVVEDETDAYAIELRIAVIYGSEIGRTAYDVQMAVRRQVIAMTGKNVNRVDVIIEGVRLPSEVNRPEQADEAWPDAPATD